jgi:hypothetical protein
MKGQDFLLLVKVLFWSEGPWSNAKIGKTLGLSSSQVHYSLKRLVKVGLIGEKTHFPKVDLMLEYIEHAIKFIHPPEWLGEKYGIPTAHSMEPLSKNINSSLVVVWPDNSRKNKGPALKPIHPGVPLASCKDRQLYEFMSLVEAYRSGRTREKQMALKEIRSRLKKRKPKFE